MKATMRVLILCLLFALTATAADSSGTWTGTFTLQGGDPQDLFLILQENLNKVTGTGGSSMDDQHPIRYGSIDGCKLTLDIAGPDGATLVLNLVQSGEEMTGSIQFTVGADVLTGSVSLERGKK